jgi:hypothetical protein
LPSGAAKAALKELGKACLKRQQSNLILVCPRLLRLEWLKQFFKAFDLALSMLAGIAGYWPRKMCEALILGFIFLSSTDTCGSSKIYGRCSQ